MCVHTVWAQKNRQMVTQFARMWYETRSLARKEFDI